MMNRGGPGLAVAPPRRASTPNPYLKPGGPRVSRRGSSPQLSQSLGGGGNGRAAHQTAAEFGMPDVKLQTLLVPADTFGVGVGGGGPAGGPGAGARVSRLGGARYAGSVGGGFDNTRGTRR